MDQPTASQLTPLPWPDAATRFHISRVFEAILFAASQPVPLEKLRAIALSLAAVKPSDVRQLLEELAHDYAVQKRAFNLHKTSEGYILASSPLYAAYIEQLQGVKSSERLSAKSAEVVAIIAYKQPITKAQIEALRGVDCSAPLQNLLEKKLIQASGKLEAPGRPTLYTVTPFFLDYFGLKSLSELPPFASI